ncbi:unnamed protein product, partial [Medioppia subpectinata]
KMLTRVQRELSSVHPLSLYRKQRRSSSTAPGSAGRRQSVTVSGVNGHANGPVNCAPPAGQALVANCSTSTTTSSTATTVVANDNSVGAKRLKKILSEVKERREIRERKKSDLQDMDGSDPDITVYFTDPEFTKTINYQEKLKVYNFLNNPQSFWARSYHILVFMFVFAGLIVTVFSNIGKFASSAWKFIYLFEKFIIIWFSFEFILRLWSSSCKQQYEGWRGKIRYLSVPAHVLDLIIICSSILIVIPIHTRNGSEVFAVSAFRGFHRFFSVLQIVTLNRQLKPWKVLSSVIYDQREQLFIIFYIEFIVLCILAYISYIVEKDDNEQFDNIAEAMWWSVVTLSTVGYGDRIPVTWLGKLVSSVFTVLGVAIFALPAGIIGAGLALKIEEEERNRQRRKKKVAAATLIQCAWRLSKANVNIIESYKYGQLDVMSKVGHMQTTIDTIGTRVGLNENSIQSSQSVLNQKIDSIDALITEIQHKLDQQMAIIARLCGHIRCLITGSSTVSMRSHAMAYKRSIRVVTVNGGRSKGSVIYYLFVDCIDEIARNGIQAVNTYCDCKHGSEWQTVA